MLRQLELSDDLGPEQRDHVRGHAEPKSREDLLGYRGPAENVAPFEHDYLQARPREVGRRHQPVVPAADHDGVVHTSVGCALPGRHQQRHAPRRGKV